MLLLGLASVDPTRDQWSACMTCLQLDIYCLPWAAVYLGGPQVPARRRLRNEVR